MKDSFQIAAIADIHCSQSSRGKLEPLFLQMKEKADAILICGDITDYGLPEEARIFVQEARTAGNVPLLAVLGNHDYESGKEEEIKQILSQGNVKVLDGSSFEIGEVGFAGVKGFAGGFGARELQAWGEPSIKSFVNAAVDEALKLESALSRLNTAQKIVLLHYSPIEATAQGEPREIFPFLGSSRLEEAINRYPVAACFHGHAHYGQPEGQTSSGVPVYNVALPVMRKYFPDQLPFRFFSLPLTTEVHHG